MPFGEARRWALGDKKADFYTRDARARPGDKERERHRKKVIKPIDMPWEDSPQGRLKHICNASMDVRVNSVHMGYDDVEQIEPAPGWTAR